MKNFYIFFTAFLISGLGFGQSTISGGTQPTGGIISSLEDTVGDAVSVFEFIITDGSDAPSTELPTIITSIRIRKGSSSANWISSIEGITLTNNIDGLVSLNSVTINANTIDISINSGGLEIPPGESRTMTLGIYFKTSGLLIDNSTLDFIIDNAIGEITTESGTSSTISVPSDIVGSTFIIEVIATQLTFLTLPTNVALGAVMTPAVEVGFTDENDNVDVDANFDPGNGVSTAVQIRSSENNIYAASLQIIPAFDGIASFNSLIFNSQVNDVTLSAEDFFNFLGVEEAVDSNTFDVTSLPTQTSYTYDGSLLPSEPWSPSDPSGVSQSTDKIVVASGDAHITADTFIYDVEVQPGASLTVDAGVTLSVIDNLTLDSQSNSYSSFIFNGTPNSNFTDFELGTVVGGPLFYKRFVNSQANGNDLIAPPFQNQDWSDFLASGPTGATNATKLFNDGNTGPTTYLFGPINKSTLLASNIYENWNSASSETLVSATGYRAATVSGTTLTFSGNLQRESLGTGLIFTGAHFPDWNLVGNPFPSYISIADFLSYVIEEAIPGDPGVPEVKNIDLFALNSGIYGYDGDLSNGWDVITVSNAGTRLMAPGQGFLVPARPNISTFGGGNIIFDPSMRKTGSSDDFIAGRNAALTFVKMKAYTATKSYNTQFYFNENSSLGLDHGYDGKILGAAPSFALYSNAIGDETQLPLALQSLHTTDLTNTTIPLGVKSNAGQQITFTITEMNLPSTIEVYLEDTVANTFTLLNDGDYTITPISNLNGTGRFYLRFGDTALSTIDTSLNDLQIYTDYKAGNLVISGNLTEATSAKVYDIEGRLVSTTKLTAASQTQTIDMSSLSAGVYVVQLANRTQSKTQKVIWR